MAARSSLDRQFVPLLEPNSHRTRTEHVQNEEYFSVRREPATVMLRTNTEINDALAPQIAKHSGLFSPANCSTYFCVCPKLANFFVSLCSDRASYSVGSTYFVDGGMLKTI